MFNTNQEIFTAVWDYFVIQNNPPAYDEENRKCFYRSPDGAKCAIGCLIPDNLYDERYENKGVTEVARFWIPQLFGIYVVLEFLDCLQECHDDNAKSVDFNNLMQKQMIELAEQWQLEVPQ